MLRTTTTDDGRKVTTIFFSIFVQNFRKIRPFEKKIKMWTDDGRHSTAIGYRTIGPVNLLVLVVLPMTTE